MNFDKTPGWPRSDRTFLTASILTAIIVGALLHGWVFRVPAMELGWRGEDDACYYYVIAKNLVAGHGFTFDGINRTNGFHPLWLGVTAGVFALTGNDAAALVTIYGLQWALFIASAVGVACLARRCLSTPVALAAMLLFLTLPTVSASLLSGMETTLAVALVVATFCFLDRALRRDEGPTTLDLTILSMLSALTMLARLECGIITAVVGFSLWRNRRTRNVASVMAYGVMALAPLAAWLYFSQTYFGSVSPVSGMIKRAGALATAQAMLASGDYLQFLNRMFELRIPSDGITAVIESQSGRTVPAFVTRGLGYLCLLGPLLIPAIRLRLAPGLRAMMQLAVLIVVAGKILFYGRPVAAYYLVPLFATFPIAICLLLDDVFRRVAAWATAPTRERWGGHGEVVAGFSAACMALIVVLVAARHQHHEQHRILTRRDGYHDSVYAAARWVETNVPPGGTVAAWNAGIIGFYSGRRVVNLDGYVNSVDYARSLTSPARDWPSLVDRLGADVIVDRISDGQTPIDRVPDLANNWREIARENSQYPHSLNGGFCAYSRNETVHDMLRAAVDPLD